MIVSPHTARDVSNGDADKMFRQFWQKRYMEQSDGDRRLVERVEGSEVIFAGDAERTLDSVAHQRVGENLSVCFARAPRRLSRNVLKFDQVLGSAVRDEPPPGPSKMRMQASSICARMASRAASLSCASMASNIMTCSVCTALKCSRGRVSVRLRARLIANSIGTRIDCITASKNSLPEARATAM